MNGPGFFRKLKKTRSLRMPEPAKLGFFGPMKTLGSATWDIEELPGGGVRAWIVHNIEESGETEKFVPLLYAHAMDGDG